MYNTEESLRYSTFIQKRRGEAGWKPAGTKMIGREYEKSVLQECLSSPRPEFLAVYGRRRVGKTFLIKEYFRESFAFYATGVSGLNTRQQLRVFHEALLNYGEQNRTIPKDWLEAFSRLEKLLSSPHVRREYQSGKRVVFLDELPWMDTARSDFKSALDYFWNSWGSSQADLILIVCGSATSWILNHIVRDTGGFYNRITRQIRLMPFCLEECEQLLSANGMRLTKRQVIECYMILGGIPYYLNYLTPQYSLSQNIDKLFFQENGPLRYEYAQLYSSLFKKPGNHLAIIEALASKRSGLTRTELQAVKDVPDGKELTKCLDELEQCGFIRKYTDFTRKNSGFIFQLIDPLTLFHLTWLKHQKISSWTDLLNTPAYYTWCGLAFERVCQLHTRQIKNALGILGVSSFEFAWKSRKQHPGAQIDLLIDRKDDVINLCEIKYASEEYAMDAACEKDLLYKAEAFRTETGTRKALLLTMITLNGLRKNEYRNIVAHEITGDDLFRPIP